MNSSRAVPSPAGSQEAALTGDPLPEGLAPDIDPVRFARAGERLAGVTLASRMPRLLASDELDRVRQFLVLSLQFAPVLACGRCLGPLAVDDLSISRRFRLAATERQADLEDPEAGSDVDVIAATPRLDLAALIEGEAMLMLPMAVAHEVCPSPATLN